MQYVDAKGAAKDAPGPRPAAKLYSIAGLLGGREFAGEFEVRDGKHGFTFAPTSAALSGGKLELTGRLSVSSPRGGKRAQDGVRATLVSTQGGIGPSPVRSQLLAATAQTSQTATPEQKQEQAGEANQPRVGRPGTEPAQPPPAGLPVTESTGPRGFVGAMYFRLSPLDGRRLGLLLDLSGVQLNARLAPTDDLSRDLQWLLSRVVEAVYGERPDERAASSHLNDLNRLLKA